MHSEELFTHCQWHTCLAGVLPHMQSKTEVCEDDGPRSRRILDALRRKSIQNTEEKGHHAIGS